jgi:glucose/arabinose dehydrogenase
MPRGAGRRPRAVAAGLSLAALGPPASAAPPIALEEVRGGLERPVGLTHAGDGSGRLFVVEQAGRIRILEGGDLRPTPFLDLTDRVTCCGERGLLGLAFHPRYADPASPGSGAFFVDYTTTLAGVLTTRISRFERSASDPDRADAGSERVLLAFAQPAPNHNGGQLVFGPNDGYLYVASGDGGASENAQPLDRLLGKLLRLDVDGGGLPSGSPGYAIPPDNPFVGVPGARPEIWARGLRNPWRMSFDRGAPDGCGRGDLYLGDVGQDEIEEVDRQPAASPGGENYGWPCYEGGLPFDLSGFPAAETLVFPILEYPHELGCSVTGGFRYRGADPRLAGIYFFADYCSGRIFAAAPDALGRWSAEVALEVPGLAAASFGEDEAGELHLVDRGGGQADGRVLRLPEARGAPAAGGALLAAGLLALRRRALRDPRAAPRAAR